MDRIAIHSADSDDLERLVALAGECPGAPRWSLNTWRQVLDSAAKGQRDVLIVLREEGIVGFGVVGSAGEVAEIESLAVAPATRRLGIGRKLCEALMASARAHGASGVSLEVRVSNDAARALYESLGFREIAIRRTYYRDPDEDGLVMAREL